ncbi:hypothetical protein ncot_07860 [Nocardioides sp. JQ2195]|uniref:ABC transporter substrate-binding protein n=1 Tax=Nocardioides sp. JQ2195 TaxID=2592334 RepID=UPI00143E41B7|nr:ABC transporter substrate-binding protein [Nocardioides sp. JQ2195]QIX26528.1 hypothetical protein ncot_07860 [Nocardioides sp. JQ2195]
MTASLDPADAAEPAQMSLGTWPVYDTLLQVDKDANYQPMLATKWEFTPDGKTVNLTLRDGVTFSDGTPFNAEAVKANLDHSMAADGSALQANLTMVASVEATGEMTVAVHLKQPTTAILSTLASNLGGIMISPKALTDGNLASHPVGTGAYEIESFKPGEQAVYVRRSDKGGIWDPGTGKVAKVVIARIASPDAKINALKSGQIDLTTWEGDDATYGSEVSAGSIQTAPMDGVLNLVGLYFNLKVKPLDNVKVRQAINYAIDRDAIVEAFAPVNQPRVQPWPEGLTGFETSREDAYSYDPAKAKELLAEAGYPDGFSVPGDFLVSNSSNIDKTGEAIQANLSEVGIEINLRSTDILSQITSYSGGKEPGQVNYMSLPSIDAYAWLQRLFVNPVWNPGGTSPELLELVKGADDPTISESDRATMVGAAVDHVTENALFAPLWQGVGGLAASSKVKDLDKIVGTYMGVANLRYVSMTK